MSKHRSRLEIKQERSHFKLPSLMPPISEMIAEMIREDKGRSTLPQIKQGMHTYSSKVHTKKQAAALEEEEDDGEEKEEAVEETKTQRKTKRRRDEIDFDPILNRQPLGTLKVPQGTRYKAGKKRKNKTHRSRKQKTRRSRK
jgi:hypothetical protein